MEPKQPKQSMKQWKAIDWDEIHHRMQTAAEVVERGWTPAPEDVKRILQARAQALARELQPEQSDQAYVQVVAFHLAQEVYAIESSFIREIVPLKELTPLPCVPPFVLGLTNVRGQILSIIDLKKFFDLPERGLTDMNRIIILHGNGMEFGILADAILDVRSVPVNELQTALPTLTGIRQEYLKGITAEQMIIIDAERVLSDVRLIVHEEVDL